MGVAASGLTPSNEEWELLRAAHPNVLVVGAEAAVVAILHGLRRSCRQPVARELI